MTDTSIPHLSGLLASHPTVDLGVVPTLIEACPNLGQELGIDLFVKRDDSLPLGMGGNKVRQLEYYLGPARAAGADTVLITGAVQSNFVRLCAAAARKIGMKPIVQLEHRVARQDPLYETSGNVLLNRMMGAEIHYFHTGEDESAADAQLDALAERERHKGRVPYVVHLGLEHMPIGALGYVEAAAEIFAQCKASGQWPDHIVVGSGSGLTHAGLLCGARALGWNVPVHGICVRRDANAQRDRLRQRCAETIALLGADMTFEEGDIRVDDTLLPPGYGQINDGVREACEMAATCEGMILDPVYTGRVMAGMIQQIREEVIPQGARVMMIHTGGLPGVFAYQSDLT